MAKKIKKQEQSLETSNHDEAPKTIVETPEGELFQNQETPKPAKPSRRPYLALAEKLLIEGSHSRKELIATLREAHPEASKSGVETFVSDLPNPKYCFFKDRSVVKTPEGKLQFADKVVLPAEPSLEEVAPEAPTERLQPEQPAE